MKRCQCCGTMARRVGARFCFRCGARLDDPIGELLDEFFDRVADPHPFLDRWLAGGDDEE